MKIFSNLLLLFILLFSITGIANAGNETRSLRTESGKIIVLGDSFSKFNEATHQSTQIVQSYEWKENKNRYTANVYHYEINNTIYNITIVNNEIRKMEWFRK